MAEVVGAAQEECSMPSGDRTGPLGFGPRTGRAAGYCSGFRMPGYMNPYIGGGFGRGFGRGFAWGGGWGRGVWSYDPPVGGAVSSEVEQGSLERQAEFLEEELNSIRTRLAELEKSEAAKDKKEE